MAVARELMSEDVLKKIDEVLRSLEPSEEPSEQLVKVGTAMVKIGEILKGRSLRECRKIIGAASMLSND